MNYHEVHGVRWNPQQSIESIVLYEETVRGRDKGARLSWSGGWRRYVLAPFRFCWCLWGTFGSPLMCHAYHSMMRFSQPYASLTVPQIVMSA